MESSQNSKRSLYCSASDSETELVPLYEGGTLLINPLLLAMLVTAFRRRRNYSRIISRLLDEFVGNTALANMTAMGRIDNNGIQSREAVPFRVRKEIYCELTLFYHFCSLERVLPSNLSKIYLFLKILTERVLWYQVQ